MKLIITCAAILTLMAGCTYPPFAYDQPEYRMAVRPPFGAIPDSTFALEAKYGPFVGWKYLGTYSSREDCEHQARMCMVLHPSSTAYEPPAPPQPVYIPLTYPYEAQQ